MQCFIKIIITFIIAGLFKKTSAGKSRKNTSRMNRQHLRVDFKSLSASSTRRIVLESEALNSNQGNSNTSIPSIVLDLKYNYINIYKITHQKADFVLHPVMSEFIIMYLFLNRHSLPFLTRSECYEWSFKYGKKEAISVLKSTHTPLYTTVDHLTIHHLCWP